MTQVDAEFQSAPGLFSRSIALLILSLLGIWCMHALVYVLVPFQSVYNTHFALSLSLLYVAIAACTSFIGLKVASRLSRAPASVGAAARGPELPRLLGETSRLRLALLGITVFGLACHAYDKAILRGYDYSGCLSAVREAWLRGGENRAGPVSSIWSALGHIGIYFSAPLTLLAIFAGNRETGRARWRAHLEVGVAFACLLVYSAMISTRSAVLFFLLVVVAFHALEYAFRGGSALSYLRASIPRIAVLGLVSIAYAALLFHNRVQCHEEAQRKGYMSSYFSELGVHPGTASGMPHGSAGRRIDDSGLARLVPPEDSLARVGPLLQLESGIQALRERAAPAQPGNGALGDVVSLMGLYLNNGAWNFETTLYASRWPDIAFLNFAEAWLHRLHIRMKTPGQAPRSYGKGMISLPGSLWYDFKGAGLLLGALVHGLLIVAVGAGLTSGSRATAGASALGFILLMTINLFSPLTFAFNSMAAPFIIFALAAALLAALIGARVHGTSFDFRPPFD